MTSPIDPPEQSADTPGEDSVPAQGDNGMDEPTAAELDKARARTLRRTILRKSLRHERARSRRKQSAWSFLGSFGLIGWSVTVPTLAGLALGLYLDDVTNSETSFTITFLVVGVAVGCVVAWYWITEESRSDDE